MNASISTHSTTINFSQAINQALSDAIDADTSVILFGDGVADREGGGGVKVTPGLSTRFESDRVRSTPIAEQAIVGAAIGAALAGMRPVQRLC